MFGLFTCGRKKQISLRQRVLSYFNELTAGQTGSWAFVQDEPNYIINCYVEKNNAINAVMRLHANGYAAKIVNCGTYDVLRIEFSAMQKHELFVTIAEKEMANKSNWCCFTRR